MSADIAQARTIRAPGVPFFVLQEQLCRVRLKGYSAQVAFLHPDKAAEPWARYAGRSIKAP